MGSLTNGHGLRLPGHVEEGVGDEVPAADVLEGQGELVVGGHPAAGAVGGVGAVVHQDAAAGGRVVAVAQDVHRDVAAQVKGVLHAVVHLLEEKKRNYAIIFFVPYDFFSSFYIHLARSVNKPEHLPRLVCYGRCSSSSFSSPHPLRGRHPWTAAPVPLLRRLPLVPLPVVVGDEHVGGGLVREGEVEGEVAEGEEVEGQLVGRAHGQDGPQRPAAAAPARCGCAGPEGGGPVEAECLRGEDDGGAGGGDGLRAGVAGEDVLPKAAVAVVGAGGEAALRAELGLAAPLPAGVPAWMDRDIV